MEASKAVQDGAEEVDMVINIGALKDKNFYYVEEDIKAVAEAVKGKALLKVIIECCLLTDEEKVIACELSKKAGASRMGASAGIKIVEENV